MKTEVIMKRELFNNTISQSSKTGFFSATDLFNAGNRWRIKNGLSIINMSQWLQQKNVKEFKSELEKQFGNVLISGRGRGKHTWVHPYLFLDMALSISPKLKISVYDWLYDELIKYRNTSGDSYKKLTGALYIMLSNKSMFREKIIEIANKIKIECGVTDWQEASEQKLKLRDKIHEYFSLLSDIINDADICLDVAIRKAKEEL